MLDRVNELAAEAAATVPGALAYTYAAQDALSARVLVVEEGGLAFPHGSDIGAPDELVTGKWSRILDVAGFKPGMYSWWNAIPYGLDHKPTAEDKSRGRTYLSEAMAHHTHLRVVLAVGVLAREFIEAADPDMNVLVTRSPMRASAEQREEIRKTFERARRDAYPFGLDPDA